MPVRITSRHRRSTQALDRSRIERSFGVATGNGGRWRRSGAVPRAVGWRSTTSWASPTPTRGPHRHSGRMLALAGRFVEGCGETNLPLQAQPRARRRASGGGEFVRDAGRARAGDQGAREAASKSTPRSCGTSGPRWRSYVLVAIVKKELHLEASPYTLLQILSVTLFEKLSLQQALGIDLAPAGARQFQPIGSSAILTGQQRRVLPAEIVPATLRVCVVRGPSAHPSHAFQSRALRIRVPYRGQRRRNGARHRPIERTPNVKGRAPHLDRGPELRRPSMSSVAPI